MKHRPDIRKRNGFTLLELLVVLAIAGLIIALLNPQMQTAAFTLQQRHAREQIAAGAESARALAVRSGQPAVLRAVAGGTRLVISNAAAERQFPVGAGGLVLSLRPQRIVFHPDGSTTGGVLALVAAPEGAMAQTLKRPPAATATFTIDRAAGRLREGST